MRFMTIVTSASTMPPSPALEQAMGQMIDREIKSGRLLDVCGLAPLSEGARVTITDGAIRVVDGPFVEAKEVIGGYSIFEFRNKDEAIASAVEFMQLHKDFMPGWDGACEVRALDGPDAGAQ